MFCLFFYQNFNFEKFECLNSLLMSNQDSLSSSTLAKNIEIHESRPPPPLKKPKNIENGFPKAKPILKKMNVKKTVNKKEEAEDMNEEMLEGENQNDKPFAKITSRYDFNGNEITNMKESDETHLRGLHQHNDSSEKPGYAIYELAVLCRSQNSSQRAFAISMVSNIVNKNPKIIDKDIKEAQIPVIAVNALFPPTNLSVKTAAIDLITNLLTYKFKNPFSIYPYPAIPPDTVMTLEFATYASDFIEASLKNEVCLDFLAHIASKTQFDITKLSKLPPSIYLFHLSRSVFINWGTVFAKEQALSVIESFSEKNVDQDEAQYKRKLELVKEAAVVLRFIKELPSTEVLEKLPPLVLAILLSRAENIENYKKFLPSILPLCPDPFALEYISSLCSYSFMENEGKEIITIDEANKSIQNASFSSSYVIIKAFTNKHISSPLINSAAKTFNIPDKFPQTIEECWEHRDVICGFSEYVLHTRSLDILPKLLPCLFSFTNPAADMIAHNIFGLNISNERPVDPNELFGHLSKCDKSQINQILNIGIHFPMHYSLPVFDRQDENEISDIICDFLDRFEDPLPPKSLRPLDLSNYFERFLFDCFEIPSFQKMAYFCISKGADPEVRQNFWTSCSRYLSRITMKNVRKDVINVMEDDREVLACMVQTLRESRPVETDFLMIAVHQLKSYLILHKGETSGEVFFEHCKRLPEFWSSKILSFMDK